MWKISTKPDIWTWVEAGIGLNLGREVPVEDTPRILVGRVLAQFLAYWHYQIPKQFAKQVGHTDFLLIAWTAFEDWASLNSDFWNFHTHAAQVVEALEQEEWRLIAGLPEQVWKWIDEVTGVERSEWEAVPARVESVLEARPECPDCAHGICLKEIEQSLTAFDPFNIGSSSGIQLVCPNCGIALDFLVPTSSVVKHKTIGANMTKILVGMAVAPFVIMLGVSLWSVLKYILGR